MRQSTKLFILVGVALTVAGLVAGAQPLEAGPLTIGDCGAVFDRETRSLRGGECGVALSNRSLFVWGALTVGPILALCALIMDPSVGKKRDPAGK